jgi:AraC-like DNA-binding protein
MSSRKLQCTTIGPTQFGPQVQNAGLFHFPQAVEFEYKLDLHHLILIERGELSAVTSTGPVCATDQAFLCFRPATRMSYRVAADTVFYQAGVQFSQPPRHLLTPEFPEIGPLPVLTKTGEAFGELRNLFETICLELPRAGSPHHFRVQVAVYGILALLTSTLIKSAAPLAPLDAWERIHLHAASLECGQFDQAKFASELGITNEQFQRVFKQRFGMTVTACRMRARLGEAVRRLRETDAPVKAIAYSLGFDGSKGLTHAMKKYLNFTASQIRSGEAASLAATTGSSMGGFFPRNQHLLPPGDRVELLMVRKKVSQRYL